jgi:hypothetical protein
MKKYLKRFATFLASTVFIFGFCIATASAQTEANAVQTAISNQRSDCSGSNPLLYRCQNPLFLVPQCIGTGIDQPGQAQHICGGIFQRRRIIVSGGTPYCQTTYDLSPWGAVLNYPTYKCFSGLPA